MTAAAVVGRLIPLALVLAAAAADAASLGSRRAASASAIGAAFGRNAAGLFGRRPAKSRRYRVHEFRPPRSSVADRIRSQLTTSCTRSLRRTAGGEGIPRASGRQDGHGAGGAAMGIGGRATSSSRDVPSLERWAARSGIRFGDGITLERSSSGGDGAAATARADGGGDWGVKLGGGTSGGGGDGVANDSRRRHRAGDVVLSIPGRLVLTSADLPRLLAAPGNGLARASGALNELGMAEYEPEFILVVRVVEEMTRGPSGEWHGWLRSLPTEFSTGAYMDDLERSYVRRFASEFLDAQERQMEAFALAFHSVLEESSESLEDAHTESIRELLSTDSDVLRWAYSVVFTRSWRSKSRSDVATIVPMADFFNHRHPANVVVEEHSDSGSIDIVLTDNGADEDGALYLSYGIAHLPARFLVIFGFVDESCPAVFSNITLADIDATTEQHELDEVGFTDWSKMSYRVRDGAVPDAVWDAVLYQVLGPNEDDDGNRDGGAHRRSDDRRKRFLDALLNDDGKAIDEIYSRYGLRAAYALRHHVEQTLMIMYPKELSSQCCFEDDYLQQHPRLEMIGRYVSWMRTILQRVQAHIDETIDTMESR